MADKNKVRTLTAMMLVVLMACGLVLSGCNRPKPYDEELTFRMADSIHSVRLYVENEDHILNINMFVEKQGFSTIRSRYLGGASFTKRDAQYTVPMEQNYIATDLSAKEKKYYEELAPITLDIRLDKAQKGYLIRLHDSSCPALNMPKEVLVASAADLDTTLPKWVWIVILIFVVLAISGIFFGRKEEEYSPADKAEIEKRRRQIPFTRKEQNAILDLAFRFFTFEDKDPNRWSLWFKIANAKGLIPKGKTPKLSFDEILSILDDMTDKQHQFVLGMLIYLAVVDGGSTYMEGGIIQELAQRWYRSHTDYIEMEHFFQEHDVVITD